MVDDRDVVIGNTAQMERVGVDPAPLEDAAEARRADGAGVMLVAVDGQLAGLLAVADPIRERSEEHTSELQSLMRISYAVFCLKKKKTEKSTNIKYTRTDNASITRNIQQQLRN